MSETQNEEAQPTPETTEAPTTEPDTTTTEPASPTTEETVDPNTPPGPATDDPESLENLQAEMLKYQRAYREEMEAAARLADDKETTFNSALEYFEKNVPLAAAQIIHLLQYSTSDSTRLGASKYVIECVRRGVVDDIQDPVSAILRELKANPGPRIKTTS
jgi:hypothetical protein